MHPLLQFNDEALLTLALTHRSFVNEHPGEGPDNERLEFLGDSILNFLSGEYLYRQDPALGEAAMTRRRSALVDEPQLARFALAVGLDRRMRLGRGAIQDGGFENPNLLSSTFEAVVGAYYLDKGSNIEILRPLVESLFESVPPDEMATRSDVDVKGQLQVFVQVNWGGILPEYVTEKVGGQDHAPEFRAQVLIDGQVYGEGRDRSKKGAEKQAAAAAIAKLKRQRLL